MECASGMGLGQRSLRRPERCGTSRDQSRARFCRDSRYYQLGYPALQAQMVGDTRSCRAPLPRHLSHFHYPRYRPATGFRGERTNGRYRTCLSGDNTWRACRSTPAVQAGEKHASERGLPPSAFASIVVCPRAQLSQPAATAAQYYQKRLVPVGYLARCQTIKGSKAPVSAAFCNWAIWSDTAFLACPGIGVP